MSFASMLGARVVVDAYSTSYNDRDPENPGDVTYIPPVPNREPIVEEDQNRLERINCSGLTKALFKWGPGAMATTSVCMRLFSCDSVLDSDCNDKEHITNIELFYFIYTASILIYDGAKWARSNQSYTHLQRREQMSSEFLGGQIFVSLLSSF